MMETEQTTVSCHAPGQTFVRTGPSSSTRGALSDITFRFDGDKVRYTGKLIGVDVVPDAEGEKMCWDSMMKLKGFEAAARKQGKHKQRIWLKFSSSGLRIVDARTRIVLHDHDWSRISSLTKDKSDPRSLAYVYQHQDTYILFYIKMSNLADPVLADLEEVCRTLDYEIPQEAAETQTQTDSLPLNNSSAIPDKGPALEDVFSPRPDSSLVQSNLASSSNELMEVFSIQMKEPLIPHQASCIHQPESPPPPPPPPTLSASQILSMFPTQPVGGSPYSSPPCSPTAAMPWGQQQLLRNQWASPAVAPWPTMPGGMAAWVPAGISGSQPGAMMTENTPPSPNVVKGHPAPVNPYYAPAGQSGPPQSVSPTLDHNLLL